MRRAIAALLLLELLCGAVMLRGGGTVVAPPSGPLGLVLIRQDGTTIATFDQTLAGADQRYVGAFVDQHSYRQDSPDGNWHVFFRQDQNGSRDEVVVEYFQMQATGNAQLDYADPYSALIYKNGTLVTTMHAPWHSAWTRWRWCTGGVDGAPCAHRSIVNRGAGATPMDSLQTAKLVLPYDKSMFTFSGSQYYLPYPTLHGFNLASTTIPYQGPMDGSGISRNMGVGGEREDLGWVPEHQAAYIVDPTDTTAAQTMWTWAEAASSIPWHWRDLGAGGFTNSGKPVDIVAHNVPGFAYEPNGGTNNPLQNPRFTAWEGFALQDSFGFGTQQDMRGEISGTTLTVSDVHIQNYNPIMPGQYLYLMDPTLDSGLTAGTTIVSQLSGAFGGAGTYQLSASSTVAPGTWMMTSWGISLATASGANATNSLTIDHLDAGTVSVGDTVNLSQCANAVTSGGPTSYTLAGSTLCGSIPATWTHQQILLGSATKGGTPPASAPTVNSVVGGSLPGSSYSVQTAYTDANGNRSPASPPSIITTTANHLFVVNAPPPRSGATGWVPLVQRCAPGNGCRAWYPTQQMTTAMSLSTATWTQPFSDVNIGPWILNDQHPPFPNYLPFLLTDDPYYLEEMQFAANFTTMAGNNESYTDIIGTVLGEFQYTARGMAWGFRGFINTLVAMGLVSTTPGYMLPASYFSTIISNNRAILDLYQSPPHNDGGNLALILQRVPHPVGQVSVTAPWQVGYLNLALGFGIYSGVLSGTAWTNDYANTMSTAIAMTNGTSGWCRQFPVGFALDWSTAPPAGTLQENQRILDLGLSQGDYDSSTVADLATAFTLNYHWGAAFQGDYGVSGDLWGRAMTLPCDNTNSARLWPVAPDGNYTQIAWAIMRLAAINGNTTAQGIISNWYDAAMKVIFDPIGTGCPSAPGGFNPATIDTYCNTAGMSYKNAIKAWP